LVLLKGIDDEVSASHIAQVAEEINEPVGTILRRLQKFAPLGLSLPAADPDKLADLTVTQNDLALLSMNMDGTSPWIKKEVSLGHIARAAGTLNEPVAAVFRTLQRFIPLGLILPPTDPNQIADLTITQKD